MNNLMPTQKEFEILRVLADNPSGIYGLQIVRKSDGVVKRGSVYVLLSLLEKKGFVKSTPVDDPYQSGTPRRTYKIRALGHRVLGFADEFLGTGGLCGA